MPNDGKHGKSKRALRRLYETELNTLPVGDPKRISLIDKMSKLEGVTAPRKQKQVLCVEDCNELATHGTLFCAAHRICQYLGCKSKNGGRSPDDIFCQAHTAELDAIEPR
jgi:hypothetical protein